MVGLDGHAFEQALGDGEEQGSLGCCSPWGRKELNTTKRLNGTDTHTQKEMAAHSSILAW